MNLKAISQYIEEILRKDHRRTVILSLSGVSVLILLGFAYIRFMRGEWSVFFLDISISVVVIFGVWIALNSHRPDRAYLLLSVAVSVATYISFSMTGAQNIIWVYPVVVLNFCLLGTKSALILNCVLFTAIFVHYAFFISRDVLYVLGHCATLAMVGWFSFIFSWKTYDQQRQLTDLARMDPLTKVFNRLDLERTLKNQTEGSNPPSENVSIILPSFKNLP